MKIEYVHTHEDDKYTYGKTFIDKELTTTWCRIKKVGNPPLINLTGMLGTPTNRSTPEYLEACKRWPYKDPQKQKEWEAKWLTSL